MNNKFLKHNINTRHDEIEKLIYDSDEELSKGDKINKSSIFLEKFIQNEIDITKEYDFDDIVIKSTLGHSNPKIQTKNIRDAFNQGRSSIMVEDLLLGERINPDEYRLVHRNNIPELVTFTTKPLRKSIFLTGKTKEIGKFKQTTLKIGAFGHYIVNVPPGKLVKAWLGTIPIILGPGPHVIHDNNFKMDNDPLVDIITNYIKHSNYNIVRVPKGKIAKIWLGNEPYLLESRSEPYVFVSPLFNLVKANSDDLFENANSSLIIHGSLKRVMPRTGQVAITSDCGNLVIIGPSKDKTPILIENQSHLVEGFLPVNTQTMIFPTELTVKNRIKNGQTSIENAHYEEFRTKDGLPIGVKLLVVYSISDPVKVLTKLNREEIVNHIENIIVADMGAVIQQCSSHDFQNTYQIKMMPYIPNKQNNISSEFIGKLQDTVKNKLREDFSEYGIHLERINIETPKILDQKTAEQISKYSIMTAETTAKESILEKQYNIVKREAEQNAIKIKIEQNQINENQISAAEARLRAAQLTVDSVKLEAEGKAYADAASAKMMGELFKQYPELFKWEMMKLQTKAMEGINNTVISPDVAQSYFGLFPFNTEKINNFNSDV